MLFDVRNQIFAQLFSTFEARSLEKGYFVYMVMSHHRKELEMEYIYSLLDRKVDGIALLLINQGSEFEKKLLKSGVSICVILTSSDIYALRILKWLKDFAAIL